MPIQSSFARATDNDDMDVDESPPAPEHHMKSDDEDTLFATLEKLLPSRPTSKIPTSSQPPADDPLSRLFAIPGLRNALAEYAKNPGWFSEEADDDLEAEEHSMGPKADNSDDGETDLELLAELNETLKGASTGVTEGTASHYRSLMKQCTKFLAEKKFIKPGEEFFCKKPRENAAGLICAWIMDARWNQA
ncbi:hypothetical protein MPER_12151 [Moniliophthora perniciosa FA553]|nr:hypothetical protein MPER_12151 [Moniliophthora perniciosa FA553]